MPREMEDALVDEMNRLRKQADEAIQRIVDARVQGRRDDAAIRELSKLQNREVELMRPVFADVA